MDETRWNAIRERLDELVDNDEDVLGFVNDLDEEKAAGRRTGRQAVVVFVRRKKPDAELDPGRRLPDEIDGIPVDVRAVGDVKLLSDEAATDTVTDDDATVDAAALGATRKTVRPLIGGISSAAATPPKLVGTLGYFVKDTSGYWYALSCAHIYGMLPQPPPLTPGPTSDKVVYGPPIVQPSPGDGGSVAASQIGTLWNSVFDDTVDAAIALLDVEAQAALRDLPAPPGVAQAANGMGVAKSGRSTGVRKGTIEHTSITITVPIRGVDHKFTKVIAIQPDGAYFSADGDSGSLVVSRSSHEAVGLLFAGLDGPAPYHGPGPPIMIELSAYACHIEDVLGKLHVSLVAPTDVYH
jgi:hypothetical protein